MVLAVCSIGQLGWTYVHTQQQAGPIEKQVEQQRDAYQELRRAHTADHSDESAVDALDPGGAIRKGIEAAEHPAAEADH